MPPNAARTIFVWAKAAADFTPVANIPYDVSEEQLAGVFSEAGPVANVEIKFDAQTGRSKGYAFVQFYDEPTASSAVRNLSNVEVNGRNLRVEASTDEPGPRRGGGGGGGGGGGRGGGGGGGGGRNGRDDTPPKLNRFGGPPSIPLPLPLPTNHQGYPPPQSFAGGPGPGPGVPNDSQSAPRVDITLLPQGQELPLSAKATDAISKTLAAVSPGQMQDVMAGMKTLVMTQPDQARQLLQSKPQLAYALFQAMLLLNIVDASVLQRIQPIPAPQSQFPSYPPQPPQQPNFAPPQNAYRPLNPSAQSQQYNTPPPPPLNTSGPTGGYGGYPPAGGGMGRAPVPVPSQQPVGLAALPPQAQAALAGLPDDQKNMLVTVLQLTPDQITALDPAQRASIIQLRQQFLGTA